MKRALTVLIALCICAQAVRAQERTEPTIDSIEPAVFSAGRPAVLVLRGTGFGDNTERLSATLAYGARDETSLKFIEAPPLVTEIATATDNEIHIVVPRIRDPFDPSSVFIRLRLVASGKHLERRVVIYRNVVMEALELRLNKKMDEPAIIDHLYNENLNVVRASARKTVFETCEFPKDIFGNI